MEQLMEKYIKLDNKWIFTGWSKLDEKFEISKKENEKFIYITNKYLNGKIEETKYRKNKGGKENE